MISDVYKSQLRQDLPISINDIVSLPCREDLFSRNFAYTKFRENKVLAKNYEFTVFPVRKHAKTFFLPYLKDDQCK